MCIDKEKHALLEAAVNFIQTYPPTDFNLPYFQICIMSGRLEEATDALHNFIHKPIAKKG